jgi:hypothetical protein
MKGRLHKFELELWPRDYYKTTCREAQVIQLLLWDPAMTFTWWHDVEEKAQEVAVKVGRLLQTCEFLRRLVPPGFLPGKMQKKFIQNTGFRMPANLKGAERAPTFRAMGVGSEGTGGHSRVGVLDDPIGFNTIADNLMPSRRRWFSLTALNVVRTDVGWIVAQGTRWDQNDIFADWIASPQWLCRTRACYETDGRPDWNGSPVLYTAEEISRKRERMLAQGSAWEFAAQMMNDPLPAGQLPWGKAECEHFITKKEAEGKGTTIALSDPAPANIGSFDSRGEQERKDGSKNYWANAVVKLRQNGMRREIILLDGQLSQGWDHDEGFARLCQMQRRWSAPKLAYEAVGQAIALYDETHRRIARREGVPHHRIELEGTYRGKNARFGALASRAKNDEFLIADTVPGDFLEVFLEQARTWRPLPNGRNGLRFDDAADVVSMATDPAFSSYYPVWQPTGEAWSPFKEREVEETSGSRHVQWS